MKTVNQKVCKLFKSHDTIPKVISYNSICMDVTERKPSNATSIIYMMTLVGLSGIVVKMLAILHKEIHLYKYK